MSNKLALPGMSTKPATEIITDVVPVTNRIVLYTDGSSRQLNPRDNDASTRYLLGGWGIHGYIYTDEKPKQGHGCKKGYPAKFGYCLDKSEPPVTVSQYVEKYGLMMDVHSDKAEIEALYEALLFIKANQSTYNFTYAIVRADAEYVVKAFDNWMHTWEKNNWTKSEGEIKNLERWKLLFALKQELIGLGIVIQIVHVKAHNGETGNERADLLSNFAYIYHTKNVPLTVDWYFTKAEEFWKVSASYTRLLNLGRWLFVNGSGPLLSNDGRWTYHMVDPGDKVDDDQIGKPIADACYAVVYLKEPCEVLETVRGYQDVICDGGSQNAFIGRLDNILMSSNYAIIRDTKDTFLYRGGRRLRNMCLLRDVLITVERSPAYLSFSAIEAAQEVQSKLDMYLARDVNADAFELTDITDILYELVDGKKPSTKLRKQFTSTMKSTEVSVNYDVKNPELPNQGKGTLPVTLTFGIDILDRNTLAAIAEEQPKVYVMTWKYSPTLFRFLTIVETANDVGAWGAVFQYPRIVPTN